MSKAKITLMGLEAYMNAENKSLFCNVKIPDGIYKKDLIDVIMLRAGEFEVLYSNPDFLATAIRLWFDKYNRTFNKWIKALETEYNPLENYDRMEEWTDVGQTNSQGHSNGSDSSSSTGSRSAYDDETFDNDTLTENESTTMADSSNQENSSTHRTGRTHGNIGVTTSQQMLEAELKIARWNIFEQMADLFISEFCILIY